VQTPVADPLPPTALEGTAPSITYDISDFWAYHAWLALRWPHLTSFRTQGEVRDDLADLIMTSIDVEARLANGGSHAAMSTAGNSIRITASEATHRQVAALLHDLRASRTHPCPVPAAQRADVQFGQRGLLPLLREARAHPPRLRLDSSWLRVPAEPEP
jgi:hypothetical protein